MSTLPPHVQPYKSTPWFDADSVPKGLLSEHNTKAGVWGLIEVAEGQIDYVVGAARFTLTPTTPGVAEPEQVHRVEVTGPVRFRVVFHREAGSPV